MRYHSIPLPRPAGATGAGEARPVENYARAAVQVNLTGGSARVEASNDGTNWVTIGSLVSAALAFVPIPHAVKHVRLYVVSAVGASDTAVFGGHLQDGA